MKRVLPILALVAAVAAVAGCTAGAGAPAGPADVFVRSWLLPIWQEDEPRSEEIGRPIALAATPGEYEPASVGVRARVALKRATLAPGALAGPGGASIPPAAWDVRATRYIDPSTVDAFGRWPRDKAHPLAPGYLDPAPVAAIAAGTTQQFWLTLHVPADAKPGTYRGEAKLVAEGLPAPMSLPVEVEVYPFRLGEARPTLFLAGDNWPLSEQAFADSRAHGMNSIVVNHGHLKIMPSYRGGRFEFPGMVDNVEKVVRVAQKQGLAVDRPFGVMVYKNFVGSVPAAVDEAGIASPAGHRGFDDRDDYWVFFARNETVPEPQRFRGAYRATPDPYAVPDTPYGRAVYDGWVAAIREIDAAAAKRKWAKPFYWLTDEPHVHRGRMRTALVMARATRDAGGTSLVTCNEPTVSEPDAAQQWHGAAGGEPALLFRDLLGIRCYNNGYLGPETAERTRAAHAGYSTYVNIYGNEPSAVRLQAGLLAHRLALDSIMFWQWEPIGTAPDAKGRRSTIRDWEAVREGIDDLRYLESLEDALRAGKGTPEARAEAQRVLDEVKAATPERLRGLGFTDSFTGKFLKGKTLFPPETFDELRRKVAVARAKLGD